MTAYRPSKKSRGRKKGQFKEPTGIDDLKRIVIVDNVERHLREAAADPENHATRLDIVVEASVEAARPNPPPKPTTHGL